MKTQSQQNKIANEELLQEGSTLYILHETGKFHKGERELCNKFRLSVQPDYARGVTDSDAVQYATKTRVAVNMHNELVGTSRQLLNELIYSLANQCKVLGMSDEQTADSINKNSLVIKSRELLKQAEQK